MLKPPDLHHTAPTYATVGTSLEPIRTRLRRRGATWPHRLAWSDRVKVRQTDRPKAGRRGDGKPAEGPDG